MCGIFGYISSNLNDNLLQVINAGYTIKNRGPDITITTHLQNCLLMFHRLSIMNTSRLSDQPFIYEEDYPNGDKETYYVLCNGEIYNYTSLSILYCDKKPKNDVDVIYHTFSKLHYNFNLLNNILNGEYALSIIKFLNNKLHTVWLSVDSSSVRPLFVYSDKSTLAFSSLLKGLTPITQESSKIQRLKGGDTLVIKFDDQLNITSECSSTYLEYLNSKAFTAFGITEENENLYRTIVMTFENSVYKRLQSDQPIGCLLSGGLDSSLVASVASKLLKEKGQTLRTFSIGMKGGTDLKYAKMVSEYIGSDHTEIIFNKEEGLSVLEEVIKCTETYDITTIRASTAQYLLAKWISENTDIKVVLNGDGSDEISMGYLYFHNAPSDTQAHIECMKLIDEIHLYDGLRVDRNISHWGLEARVPFLDKEMVRLFKTIHPSLKGCCNRIEKYILRRAFDVYYNKNPILPKEVLYRVKEALSDAVSTVEESWYLSVKNYVEKNKEVDESIEYTHCPPVSHESRWYRQVFEREFGKEVSHVIPHYWLPNWNGNVTEPSARVLKVYKSSQI